jgi:hypothetical protein
LENFEDYISSSSRFNIKVIAASGAAGGSAWLGVFGVDGKAFARGLTLGAGESNAIRLISSTSLRKTYPPLPGDLPLDSAQIL